jgi:hypothetical protein
MAPRGHRIAGVVVALAALALSTCQVAGPTTTTGMSSTTTSVLGGLSVGANPTDLIQDAAFVDWEDLPCPSQLVHGPDSGYRGVARVLPGSEAGRLLIAVWHDTCMPVVTVSTPDPGSAPQLVVAIGERPMEQCGDLLKMCPLR